MEELRKTFHDLWDFKESLEKPVENMINDVSLFPFQTLWASDLVKRYIPNFYRISTPLKEREKTELVFAFCYARIYQLSAVDNDYPNIDEFLDKFPSFRGLAEKEILYRFFLGTLIGVRLFKNMRSRKFTLHLGERLEGANQTYITGSRQRKEVSRRISIISSFNILLS